MPPTTTLHHHHHHHHPPPKRHPKLLSFFLKFIVLSLILALFLIFLGLAAIILLHVLFAGSFLHRRRHHHHHRNTTTTPPPTNYTLQDLQTHLPSFQYSSNSLTTTDCCSICLEGFKEGEFCRSLPECDHVFHAKCVDSWLTKVPSCPVCRRRVRLEVDRPADRSEIDDDDDEWADAIRRWQLLKHRSQPGQVILFVALCLDGTHDGLHQRTQIQPEPVKPSGRALVVGGGEFFLFEQEVHEYVFVVKELRHRHRHRPPPPSSNHHSPWTSCSKKKNPPPTTRALLLGFTGKLIIISNNCPPLRKSEIEYYAMLVEDHHYIEQVVSYVSFNSIKIDRYKQDSRNSYNLDINSQQYRWTVTLRALIEDNNVGRTMDNGFIASLQQQLQEANNEIQRLRALPGPSMTIPMSIPPPYPPQHLRPPPRPQFNASMPFSTVNQQYDNVRPSLPQFTPPIPHGPPPMPRGPPSMPQGAPMFTFEPFSQQIPIPGHIPTVASSTIHTTIPPSTGISSSCIPTIPINVEDPLNVRLKSLEEQNQKLFALLTKLPGAAVPVEVEPKTGFQASPFVDELALVDVPKKYTIPAFATKYSGITDPVEHIAQYKQLMWTVPIPAQYQEVCMCKSFGSTLTGAALQWLINLKPKSIGSFAELMNQFTRQFASSRKMEKQTSDLYYIVQKSGETIRDYFNRFNAAMIEIKNCDVKTAIEAYKRGLEDSSGLYLELTKYPPENFDDVRARTLAFMRIEDDALFRRKHSAEKKPLGAQKHDFKHKRVNKIGNPRYESKTRPSKGTVKIRYPELSTYNFAGTSKDLVDSLRKIDANVRWPKKSDKPSKDKDQNRWCDFHEDHGHTTEECISLKKEISYLKSKGHLKGLIPEEQGRPASPVHTKVINCITGGSEVCGLTYSAAKRHARDGPSEHPIPGEAKSKTEKELDAMTITFDQDDTQGVHHKHHDALVIQLTIGNCSTKRILIDGGSSANVIFADTLKVMGIERSEIVRRSTTLIGFNGDPMNTLGEIILPVYAKGINKQTKFNVVDCQSAYNVILGRPWIHEMKAIPSTYHQKIKFPSPWGIQEIASENKIARECYKITMKTKSQDI
ncbi:hypothetical protein OSB04_014984 [Centaurea solstitialis]|uniref:RING-type domain-containing protein n=1 Tax=Centaurea solstitialis TaxID=347529 RepID=A0AA38WIA0_9ASTR|nr:hypothetical protein OSB04_014984 [Centaurea solstitialis]